MHRRNLYLRATTLPVLALTLAFLSGCDEERPATDDLAVVTPPTDLRSAELLDAACPAQRQVARLATPGPCPSLAPWVDTALGVNSEFCLYEWESEDIPDFTLLDPPSGLTEYASDCGVVLEQALDPLTEVLAADLQALFRFGIGHADAIDLDLLETESARSPVVVAVVDTVPYPIPSAPESRHGMDMATLVSDIACADGSMSCAVSVYTALGLPRVAGGGNNPNGTGGYYGSQSDLALAIYDAIGHWEAVKDTAPTTKLVINISAGWEPVFGDVNSTLPPVQAVHTALEYASCLGALIVTSAGNAGHLCATGPLLPGAWETEQAPDTLRCDELDVDSTAPVGYAPLVYAVGGLSLADGQMPGSRDGAMPRLAATATHAVVGDELLRSPPLTGTSVSAAVGSGVAALAWSYSAELAPSELMETIYAAGTDMGTTATFFEPSAVDTTVRKIEACAVMNAVCSDVDSPCFGIPLGCLGEPLPVTKDEFFENLDDLLTVTTSGFSFGAPTTCSSCGAPQKGYLATSAPGGDPCNTTGPIVPYTQPQPIKYACPSCTIEPAVAVVHASLDPSYDGQTVSNVTVTVEGDTGVVDFRLGSVELTSTSTVRLDLGEIPFSVVAASISISFDGTTQPAVNDLIID